MPPRVSLGRTRLPSGGAVSASIGRGSSLTGRNSVSGPVTFASPLASCYRTRPPMTADALVRQHADLVYRVTLRVTRTPDDAADAAQDALVKVWRGIEAIEPERRRAWAARVARNTALDLLRRRGARPRPGATDPITDPACTAPLPDAHAEASDIRAELDKGLDTLGEPYRSILVLREVEGMPYADIAEALDLPLNTLKVYLLRARRRLQSAVAASSPELVP